MRSKAPKFTQADMVLIALHEAAQGSLRKVPYEEIVLTAWQRFPDSFSLRSHPEYPDSSDIHKRLYQTLIPTGCAVSLGHKIFRLTEKGQARAAKLTGVSQSSVSQGARLSRAQELFYRHARNTRAFRQWKSGKANELVDYDARLFFQFGPTSTFEDRSRRAASALETLEHATKMRLEDAKDLLDLARYLSRSFASLFSERSG